MNYKQWKHIFRDLIIIVFTVIIAVVLVKTGAVEFILRQLDGWILVANFIGGLFFTSVFTTAIATVVLGEIAQDQNIFLTAITGGVGAVIGDFVIFRFMRDHLAEDFESFLKASKLRRWRLIFHHRFFRWIFLFIGAVVVASPLPDELGLALMGFSKLRTRPFLFVSFLLNSLGILVIGIVARALA